MPIMLHHGRSLSDLDRLEAEAEAVEDQEEAEWLEAVYWSEVPFGDDDHSE